MEVILLPWKNDTTDPDQDDVQTDQDDDQKRNWADLPEELLTLIADRLMLIELLGFRGVCKDWRNASSSATAQNEGINRVPSLLVHGNDERCRFYYEGAHKLYAINIPDLANSTCLASENGWLLIAQAQERSSRMFFFCPFSRTRIDLPEFPESEISDHVASFSAPPTSPDCTVVVVRLTSDASNDTSKLEYHTLIRGASSWTKQEIETHYMDSYLSGGCYYDRDGVFYFMNENSRIIKYSTQKQKSKTYRLVRPGTATNAKTLGFSISEEGFDYPKLKKKMGLQDDFLMFICGTSFQRCKDFMEVKRNEMVEPSIVENSPDAYAKLVHLSGISIIPRFHQVPEYLSW